MIIQPMMSHAPESLLDGVAALPYLGIIRVEGEDATRFLQGQLTQDFALLGDDEARLAAYCSPKGRMLASFIGFRRGPMEILLICEADILAATLKRLGMFVLRAKVRLSDATADFTLLGLAGSTINYIANNDHSTLEKAEFCSGTLIRLPAAPGQARALWLAPKGTPWPEGRALDTDLWRWGEVRSGVAWISAPIVDAFVPQMLNYESVGGVNFKKGCYPGQEVVARSQFRGTLKRRGYIVQATAPMRAGQAVFAEADAEQPCGLVAQAAAAPGGVHEAIACLQISAAAAGGLHLDTATGPALTLLPLPYPLLDDI